MSQIPKLVCVDVAFDPEILAALGSEYDLAVAGLDDGWQPDSACEVIAERIVASAITS